MDNVINFLCYFGLYSEFNLNKFKNTVENKEYSSFIDVLINKIGPNIQKEGGILAMIKILQNYINTDNENKNEFLSNYIKFDEVLLKSGMTFYTPSNYPFILKFLNDFQNIFDSLGNTTNEGKFSESYLNFLENVYLRSFEVFDHYNSLLNLNDPIPQKFEETVSIVKNYVSLYLKQEGNDNFIKSSIKKLCNQCLNLLKNPKLDSKEKSLPFWDILYNLQLRDSNNFIISNDELTKSILNKIFETIPKYDDDLIRNNLLEITKKLEMDMEAIEKIANFANEDIVKNIGFKNETESKNMKNDLEALNNIIRYPITAKIILKNNELSNNLIKLYESDLKDPELSLLISNIIKKLTENSNNNEAILGSNPQLVSLIQSNLQTNLKQESEIEKQILNNDLAAFTNLVSENFKQLIDKNVISENDLKFVCELHAENPEYGPKLKSIMDTINSINQEQAYLQKFMKEKELVNDLIDSISKLHEKHMNEIDSLKKEDTKSMVRLSTVKIKASLRPGVNEIGSQDLPKLKSPLSVRDNPEALTKIDQILAMIIKLNNDLSQEKDQKILTEKGLLIMGLLQTLKKLSIIPDNHKPILEMGLLKFMEKITEDKNRSNKFYIDSLEISKNCTLSENAISPFIKSPVSEYIINQVINLYENTESIASDPEMKSIFIQSNAIFSNLCKSQEGFKYLFDKIGLEKFLNIAKLTNNLDILTAVLETLVNFLKNNNDVSQFIGDIIKILAKCLSIPNKTDRFATFCFLLSGLIYTPELMEQIQPLELVQAINKEFDSFKDSVEFLNSILFCLGKITMNNYVNSKEAMCGGVLHKIQNILETYISNDVLTENITALYGNLILNNIANIVEFCKNNLPMSIFFILENYLNTNFDQVTMNCIICLDQITMVDEGIQYLSYTKFQHLLLEIFDKKNGEPEIIKYCLHALGNYLYKDLGNNIKTIDFEKIIQLLILLQKKYYSNSDILININYIAGYLIKLIKDKTAKEKLYQLIGESIKIQDWNIQLIIMTLQLIYEILSSGAVPIDDIFEETMLSILNILRNHNNPEIFIYCYKILSLFSKNYIYSYTMVNNGVIELIKGALEAEFDIKTKFTLREILLQMMTHLSTDMNNSKKLAEVLMNRLVLDLNKEEYSTNHHDIVKLIYNITKHKNCIEPFVQYNGIDAVLSQLHNSLNNVGLIYDCFNLLGSVIDGMDDYKKILIQKKVPDLINSIIARSSMLDKKIEYEGRTLIFNINSCQVKLEKLEDLSFKDIKVENPIKPEIKNFVVSGKILKIYNSNGDKKKMHLSMTQDMNKISCKKPGKNLPPKPKYVIETNQIKKIIQGYGTKAFEKHSGIFKKPPPPEKCFSIIGPTTVDGEKSFNVECDSPEEANRWIEYLEIVANFFKKNQHIKKSLVKK